MSFRCLACQENGHNVFFLIPHTPTIADVAIAQNKMAWHIQRIHQPLDMPGKN